MIDLLLPPFVQLHGLFGGILGGGLSWIIQKDRIRWAIFFAFLGMLNTGILLSLQGFQEFVFYPTEIKLFTPFFTLLGAVCGIYYKKVAGKDEWRWIGVFTSYGALLGTISQIRGAIIWLIIFSLVSGTLIWYIKNPRIIWSILSSSFGALIVWSLFPRSPALSDGNLRILIGATLGGFLGWLANDNKKWLLAFIMLGIFVGSMSEWVYQWIRVWNIAYLLVGGVAWGSVGYSITVVGFRRLITLIYLCFFLFSFARLHWLYFQFSNGLL